jgi:hypothetical protein
MWVDRPVRGFALMQAIARIFFIGHRSRPIYAHKKNKEQRDAAV